ncbi:hypothetical protein C8Q75DRAFT_790091 [Abortiporus biennis]|nr:hypothetical protein C8Q75DRAFT_790091 [Abortiporus biennis]
MPSSTLSTVLSFITCGLITLGVPKGAKPLDDPVVRERLRKSPPSSSHSTATTTPRISSHTRVPSHIQTHTHTHTPRYPTEQMVTRPRAFEFVPSRASVEAARLKRNSQVQDPGTARIETRRLVSFAEDKEH